MNEISQASERAKFIRDSLPPGGLFAGLDWRISPAPFPLGENLAKEIESLGRVLLQFYRAVNLLYRKSAEGKQPEWVARWLDLGKPAELIALQRSPAFKNDVPRVIRPDILLTETGISITELDSVPGGIGLTAWLNQNVFENPEVQTVADSPKVIGGADGMLRGFESIFGDAKQVHIVVSEEAATYRPEMDWLCEQLNCRNFNDSTFNIQHSTISPMATRFIVSLSCSIWRTWRIQKRFLNWPPKNASASRRRPSRCSRKKCCSRCCGIGTCTTSGGRNWAKVFWRG